MTDFSTISDSNPNIPFTGSTATDNALNLTNPDSILSGTNRGVQNLGGTNMFSDAANNRIVVVPNTTPQVLMGNQPTFGEGFYVAKNGVNVITNTDASQFIFNSSQDVFKIVVSSTTSFAVGSLASGATSTTTIPHGQSTIPAVIAFVNGSGSTYLMANMYYSVPVTIPVSVGGKYEAGILYGFRVDSTNIYFDVSNYTSASPITDIGIATFKYYVLQETAN